ncbi:hypothetical protein F5Y08DRAFT_132707 [Xylaria arbuscula]|nr:hypothetical protein F5Y08DRAFT_132707 [Xylaria arbuscula]
MRLPPAVSAVSTHLSLCDVTYVLPPSITAFNLLLPAYIQVPRFLVELVTFFKGITYMYFRVNRHLTHTSHPACILLRLCWEIDAGLLRIFLPFTILKIYTSALDTTKLPPEPSSSYTYNTRITHIEINVCIVGKYGWKWFPSAPFRFPWSG